ncbi:MAG: hypothetical protein KBS65_04755 [Prevotella sp.]|nr:hypothetical protein [Candidatus Equicola stercoris]
MKNNRLVLVAMLFVALCTSFLFTGCKDDDNKEPSTSLLGKWSCEYYEEEWGGKCLIEYTFQENGELMMVFEIEGKRSSTSMLWRTEGDKMYTVEKSVAKLYEKTGAEWDCIDYKLSNNTLDFPGDDGTVISFTKIN